MIEQHMKEQQSKENGLQENKPMAELEQLVQKMKRKHPRYTYNCDAVKAENSEDFNTPVNNCEHSYTTDTISYDAGMSADSYTAGNGGDCTSVRKKLFKKPGIVRRLFQDEPT